MKMKRGWRVLLIVLAVLVIGITAGPFLVPVPALDTVSARELAGPDSRFVTVPVRGVEVDVHYLRAGEGEPVFVLIHGFASSTYTWRHLMEPLAAYGTVIALDWMPYGLTERPLPAEWRGGENPYSRDAQADLIVEVMDALGVEQAVLIGNSAGGALAAQVALEHPARVGGLVLVDAAIFVPQPGEQAARRGGGFGPLSSPLVRALGTTPQMRRIGPLLVRGIQEWGTEFGRSAWHNPDLITEADWEQYRLPLRVDHWDRGLYEAVIAGGPDQDVSERLDALTLPVLVVTGDDDRIVPTANSIRLAEALPGADLAVFEACGHAPQEECPAPFLEAVEGFLAGQGIQKRDGG